jgi:hypothetical protein
MYTIFMDKSQHMSSLIFKTDEVSNTQCWHYQHTEGAKLYFAKKKVNMLEKG